MSFVDEKYFAYIASTYSITLLVFVAMALWVIVQHRSHRAKLARLEQQGIKRRSGQDNE